MVMSEPKTLKERADNCILHAELDIRDNPYHDKLPEAVILLKQYVTKVEGLVAELQKRKRKPYDTNSVIGLNPQDKFRGDLILSGKNMGYNEAIEEVLVLLGAKETKQ